MAALTESGSTASIRANRFHINWAIFARAAANLFTYGHQGRAGRSPFAIFLGEHSQYPDFNLADFTVGALTFEASVIGGQRKISVERHQLEIVRVRSTS